MPNQLLKIVFIIFKIRCKVIEKIIIPRLICHHIHRMNNTPAHELLPNAIGNGTRETPIIRMRDKGSKLLKLFILG